MRMDQNSVVFTINEKEKIVLKVPVTLEKVFSFTDATVTYFNEDGVEYALFKNDVLRQAIGELSYRIQEFFEDRLKLCPSVYKDNIGYLWNEELHYMLHDDLEYEFDDEGYPHWVGKRFLLWESRGLTSWLYEKDGKCFLEITPTYKWHFNYPALREIFQYTTYETFKKNYKSVLLIELDEQLLHEWKKQADELLEIIAQADKICFAPTPEELEEREKARRWAQGGDEDDKSI